MEFVLNIDEDMLLEESRMRRELRDASNPFELEEKAFIRTFRVNKDAFKYILEQIDAKLKTPKLSSAVPAIVNLTAVLRFLAQGSYQMSVANECRVGLAQCTFANILNEVSLAMQETLCAQWIKFPTTAIELHEEKLGFFQQSGFPGVIGCVDGTHVKIVAMKKDVEHLYYNRKGFHSLNVLVVCDHQNRITYINAKFPGSTHDSMVLQMSALKQKMEELSAQHQNCWLLGDAGYPLRTYLITPYRNAATGSPQSNFNLKHARARCVVERSIGILKNRFRCLIGARALHYGPQKATRIINICAALHNICIFYKPDNPDEALEVETVELEEAAFENEASAIRDRNMATLN